MFPVIPFIIVAYILLYVLAGPSSPPTSHQRQDFHVENTNLGPQLSLDAWIHQEKNIALHNLLANISPFGSHTQHEHVAPGTVLASPSKKDPDYFYQWIRDAAITLGTLVDVYKENATSELSKARIEPILESYVRLSERLQRNPNPSGGGIDGNDGLKSLGEPKFHVDGSAFEGHWGRPQRDGPALRAITLMNYMEAYNASNPHLWIQYVSSAYASRFNPFRELYAAEMPARSIIKADLEYVSKYWNETDGFDLWEEVQGHHFFTGMVQLRALRMGGEVAGRMRDGGAKRWYLQQAKSLERVLRKNFWREGGRGTGYLIETEGTKRSGLDCGTLLGALHGLDGETPFPPWSDEVLSTLLELIRVEKKRFPLNRHRTEHYIEPIRRDSTQQGTFANQHVLSTKPILDERDEAGILSAAALGRYPEDLYTGTSSLGPSNPWFLCTSTASHILSLTAQRLLTTSHLNVTSRALAFWSSLLRLAHSTPSSSSPLSPFSPHWTALPSQDSVALKPGTYPSHSRTFQLAIQRLRQLSDDFLDIVRRHTSAEGTMSEQFDGVTGYEKGARDLTWSYGAFLDAVKAREELSRLMGLDGMG